MKVKDIMSRPVVRAHTEDSLTGVADLLSQHRISAVPIVDDQGAVIGLVSEYDLMAKEGKTAGDVMTPSVITVTPETDVDDVRVLLLDRRIRRVPVLSGRELVGVVSRGDIVALLAHEWVCVVCGEAERGARPPECCPKCGAPADRFNQQVQPPGD